MGEVPADFSHCPSPIFLLRMAPTRAIPAPSSSGAPLTSLPRSVAASETKPKLSNDERKFTVKPWHWQFRILQLPTASGRGALCVELILFV